jgi:hypothetical protein
VIPGKVNAYVGVLGRIERVNNKNSVIDKKIDAVKAKALSRIPEGALKGIATSVVEEGKFRQGSTLITVSGLKPSSPTIRATRSSARPGRSRTSRATRAGRSLGDGTPEGYASIQGERQARAGARRDALSTEVPGATRNYAPGTSGRKSSAPVTGGRVSGATAIKSSGKKQKVYKTSRKKAA